MAAPKIHFVALVSMDFDVDMLSYFIPHYNALDLDNYCIFLHEGKDTDANLWAEKAAKDAGWRCRFIPHEASYGNGELKRVLLEKFRRAAKEDDYIVTADADEFQMWKTDPRAFASEGFDLVLGRRVDRLNEKLVPVDHSIELEANYPLEHDNLSKVLFPKRPRPRDKIVMAKARIPVDYKKSVALSVKDPGNLRVTGEVPILHYKWRDNLLKRLQSRPDYTPDELNAIRTFFEVGQK